MRLVHFVGLHRIGNGARIGLEDGRGPRGEDVVAEVEVAQGLERRVLAMNGAEADGKDCD